MNLIAVLIGIVASLFGLGRQAPREPTVCDEKAKLLAEVARLEGELKDARTRLYCRTGALDNEIELLEYCSRALTWFLLVFVLVAAACTAVVLFWKTVPLRDFFLAAAAGVLGASLSGLISLNERVSNGWEFSDGTREPSPAETKERFNLRMWGSFLARPFLGLASGPLVMAGFRLGQLAPTQSPAQARGQAQALAQGLTEALAQPKPPAYAKGLAEAIAEALTEPTANSHHIFFFSLLGGLFSKTLFDWLRDVFKKVLGR